MLPIAAGWQLDLHASNMPYLMRFNGWGQLRHTNFNSEGPNPDLNQFQLKRGRLIFSGYAFRREFAYFVQLDGRSSSGDDMRLLDYFLTWDFGRQLWCCAPGTIGFKTGKYKIPFDLARYVSGKEFQFTDRSMASMYFDVNRSLAWGLYGRTSRWPIAWHWETAIFNGLVTGGAETGSSGSLDNKFAYSARVFGYPIGTWGPEDLADLSYHRTLATRIGAGFAATTVERSGSTEFNNARVVNSGATLASLLPPAVDQSSVALFSLDASCKYRGGSATIEYYFRNINRFRGGAIPDLFDHGLWFQMGYFVIPGRLELLTRWSRVDGNSGTLGAFNQSSDEVAGGFVWYFIGQNAKITIDLTRLRSAPINSSSLDISPGDTGWMARSQIQFAF